MKRARGFTLLEVLVALAIFALVAASVLSASSHSLRTAARLEDKTLAMWVADNQLSETQLSLSAPVMGKQQGRVEFAGRQWLWQSQVEETSEPEMRRVTVWVALSDERSASSDLQERALVTLVGFAGSTP